VEYYTMIWCRVGNASVSLEHPNWDLFLDALPDYFLKGLCSIASWAGQTNHTRKNNTA
jgi:hypothetical protein